MLKISSTLILLLATSVTFAGPIPKVVYGSDDRVEVSEYPNQTIKRLANSVAGMVNDYSLQESSLEGYMDFDKTSLSDRLNTCPGERFSDQVALMNCTGFLVGEDLLVTAGHCLRSTSDCTHNKWVFGFTSDKEKIAKEDMYGCSEVVAREESSLPFIGTTDFAIVRLDRKVKGRNPLKFRTKGRVKNGAGIVLIGHPLGLPMKITGNSSVHGSFGRSFSADLDAYAGNSGSPVFDASSGLVEGILVEGTQDLNYNECNSTRVSTGAREVVYKITGLKALQRLYKKNKL